MLDSTSRFLLVFIGVNYFDNALYLSLATNKEAFSCHLEPPQYPPNGIINPGVLSYSQSVELRDYLNTIINKFEESKSE